MEYCKTDLEEEIIKRLIEKNPYNESELLTNMKNLIDALAYMQKNHLAHRDIKPANILVFNNTLKIADFGLSLQQEESFETIDYKCVGTVAYLSPILKKTYLAMIEGKLWRTVNHNPIKSDVYSLGLTFLHMASLLQPCLNSGDNLKEKIEKAVNVLKYSDVVKNILREMLVIDEKKRI